MPELETNTKEIETKKVTINDLFNNYWFRIPEYQRSYVWKTGQLDELLDDLKYAFENHSEKEYFLGSVVLQKHKVTSDSVTYDSCDVLDGQQRMTTLFILMAVLRDISHDTDLTGMVKDAIYQQKNVYKNQPERIRIEFLIRDAVGEFVDKTIKTDKGTNEEKVIKAAIEGRNVSLRNMAKNMRYFREVLSKMDQKILNDLAAFIFNKVIVIYVASQNLEDAFRLFTILNDRGIPLSNSDIIKSLNIGEVESDEKRKKFAISWEKMESEFGREEFDRFLGHIRTILIKEKARENLLKEFEKIYSKGILNKGERTLEVIKLYRDIYTKIIWNNDNFLDTNFPLKNLTTIMLAGLSTDWIPPYLFYYSKFGKEKLYSFLQKLESKFSAAWILQETPTKRMRNTYAIIRAIEHADTPEELFNNAEIFKYNREELEQRISGEIYGKAFTRYLQLKQEYLLLGEDQGLPEFSRISVEHVLPQNPKTDSEWRNLFTNEERAFWTHRVGNLVLLSRRKNSKLNNSDFGIKKERYFHSSMSIFPNVAKAMQEPQWNIEVLKKRQTHLVRLIMNGYK